MTDCAKCSDAGCECEESGGPTLEERVADLETTAQFLMGMLRSLGAAVDKELVVRQVGPGKVTANWNPTGKIVKL